MTLNQLTDKVIPPLVVVATITMFSAYAELNSLVEKVDTMAVKMEVYHDGD